MVRTGIILVAIFTVLLIALGLKIYLPLWQYQRLAMFVSPDGLHVASLVSQSGSQFVEIDGESWKGKDFDEIADVTFSPDSKRVAYVVKRGNTMFVVTDRVVKRRYGQWVSMRRCQGQEYDRVDKGTLRFSSDGKRVIYKAVRNGKAVAVVDEYGSLN